MTTKAQLNARVKITAGPAANLYGRIASVDESTWSADVALDDGRIARGVPLKHTELIAEEQVSDREKLLDRIRKLHAKAESAKAIGSEAEASAFAAAVSKMLNKYRLSLADLAMSDATPAEPVSEGWSSTFEGKRAPWSDGLASVVARAHFCRVLFSTRGHSFYFVGREMDRKVAEFVLATLHRTAVELSDKAARAFRKEQRRTVGATTWENKNFRSAWLTGFVERIAERYREEEKAMEREQQATGGTSLVLVQRNALAEVDKHMQTIRTVRGRARRQRSAGVSASQAGRAAGRAAANDVNIRGTGLGSGGSRQSRQLR